MPWLAAKGRGKAEAAAAAAAGGGGWWGRCKEGVGAPWGLMPGVLLLLLLQRGREKNVRI